MTTYTAVALTSELPWQNVGSNISLVSQNGYFVTANCTLTMPTTAALGEIIEIALTTATDVIIQLNGGQTISGPGGTGTAGSTVVADTAGTVLRLVCSAADTSWQLLSDQISVTIN